MIGAALGTAILPQVSRHVGAGEPDKAARVQGQAAELAMLLCLPAALALAVERLARWSRALFQGGQFTAARTPAHRADAVDHRRSGFRPMCW